METLFCITRDGKSSSEIIPACSCSATCPPLEGGPGDRPTSSYILLLTTPWPFTTGCCCAEECASLSGAPKHLKAAAGSGCSEVLLGASLLSLGKSKLSLHLCFPMQPQGKGALGRARLQGMSLPEDPFICQQVREVCMWAGSLPHLCRCLILLG